MLTADGMFGAALHELSDLDGDGVDDKVTSAFREDLGGVDKGAVYILFMNPNASVKSHVKIGQSTGGFGSQLDAGDFFGSSVADIGDLDQDGNTDIAVGALRDDDGGIDKGAIWILFLNANGTVKAEQKISEFNGGFNRTLDADGRFGESVCNLGDIDGDGIQDLGVGNIQDNSSGFRAGAAFVLMMNRNGTVKSHVKIANGSGGFTGILDAGDRFGASVFRIPDLDLDGRDELYVGAIMDDDGGNDRGAIWVLFLNATGNVKNLHKVSTTIGGFTGNVTNGDRFGVSGFAMPDLNGDGNSEIIVGSDGSSNGQLKGSFWILYMNANGSVNGQQEISDADPKLNGRIVNGDQFARGVTVLQDLNNDGLVELAIGTQRDDEIANDAGAIYIFNIIDSCKLKSGAFRGSTQEDTLCAGETITIGNTYSGNRTYQWNTGDTTPLITADTGIYWVLAILQKDTIADTFNLRLKAFNSRVFSDTICNGDSLRITRGANGDVLWSDGDTMATKYLPPGNIWVQVDSLACTYVDSFKISSVLIDKEILNTNVITCNQNVLLPANTTLDIVWDNGSTEKQRNFTSSGVYWIETGIGNCIWRDSVRLTFKDRPSLDLVYEPTICEGDTVQIAFTSSVNSVFYNGERVRSPLLVDLAGSYVFRAVENDCEIEKEAYILPTTGDKLINDTSICLGASAWVFDDLLANNPNYGLIDSLVLTSANLGDQILEIRPERCFSSDSTISTISLIDCACDRIFIPNAFSPNLDSDNPYFAVESECTFDEYKLSIYDRWGRLIFLTNSQEVYWDGTCPEKECQVGTYLYEL